jgi:hypothetical protein
VSESSQVDAWWHGARGQQLLIADGWVGEHPGDGGDVAHMLLHPAGHGAAGEMRALATALGLPRADTPVEITRVPTATAAAWIDTDSVVHLHGPGTQLVERPVDGMWWATATTRGYVALSVGMDPLLWLPGDWETLDQYLDRRHRYHLGLVDVLRA